MSMQLIFATQNVNKAKEINCMLGDDFVVKSMQDVGIKTQIEETGNTLEENSYLKAAAVFETCKISCFADDSGLEVAALNNAPGVYSSRYAGENASDENNTDLLLKNLENVSDRSAQFRTIITLILNENESYQFEGIVKGKLLHEKRGTQGFGYDPIFVPNGFSQTFAEMSMDEKNRISHRAKAFARLKDFLLRN